MAIEKDWALAGPLRTLFNLGAVRDWTDGQLLERFATDRGEVAELAFAALVERHGPMVLRVCRGVLADTHDAQDAFQATFLVLVRRARGLWVRDSLGPWLHQVAYRTASCARSAAARRLRHERRAASRERVTDGADGELARILHEEIERLPDRYRLAVVLCDLGGRTHEQAASQLSWPVGTVKSRLSRGRDRLRHRLVRRGLAPGAGVVVTLARPGGIEASIPPELLKSTIALAVRAATVTSIVGGTVGLLAKEVLRAMILSRCLKVAPVLCALLAMTSGVYLLAQEGPSSTPPSPDPGVVRSDPTPAVEVGQGKRLAIVSEPGQVGATTIETVISRVEGEATLRSILPEWTRVEKGQLVAEIDTAALEATHSNQKFAVQMAEARHENARLRFEIAKINIIEYEEGTFKQEQATLRGEEALARAGLARAEDRLERTRRARKQLDDLLAAHHGPESAYDIMADLNIDDRLEAEEMTIRQKGFEIEVAKTKQQVLEEYTRDKTIKELRSEVAKAEADERSQAATWELERSKERRLEDQIEQCKLYAPAAGILQHGGLSGPILRVGSVIREKQPIFSILDPDGFVARAEVSGQEAADRVARGQRARVTVDSLPGVTLTGVVESPPSPPLPLGAVGPSGLCVIKIEGTPERLLPGMRARAEIQVGASDDGLTVPPSALIRFDDKDHVKVRTAGGDYAWREVTVGEPDGASVEILDGVEAGEVVVSNPASVMSGQELSDYMSHVEKQPYMDGSRDRRRFQPRH